MSIQIKEHREQLSQDEWGDCFVFWALVRMYYFNRMYIQWMIVLLIWMSIQIKEHRDQLSQDEQGDCLSFGLMPECVFWYLDQ